jgi:hypothetical protein
MTRGTDFLYFSHFVCLFFLEEEAHRIECFQFDFIPPVLLVKQNYILSVVKVEDSSETLPEHLGQFGRSNDILLNVPVYKPVLCIDDDPHLECSIFGCSFASLSPVGLLGLFILLGVLDHASLAVVANEGLFFGLVVVFGAVADRSDTDFDIVVG